MSKPYTEFLADMGELLKASMPRTDRERDDLADAEADFRRIKSNLAVARQRRDLARTRYERERSVLMEMFETWKGEVQRLSGAEAAEANAELSEMRDDE